MTTVNSATGIPTSSQSASSSSTTSNAPTLDYNSFLTLLVAEMKNQDPTQPTDPMQYTSQLASFSAVEQQVNANKKLDSMMTNSALTFASQVVGHTVTSADGTQTGTVTAVAIDPDGTMVAKMKEGFAMQLTSNVIIS